jgi:enamine deaminase RidA (YjgF/YER057c/UK114 family)
MIKRIRVEPISGYLERYRKAQAFPVTVANGFVYLSGLPPFDPQSGEVARVPFEQQAEIVLAQMQHCLEAAGSSMRHVLKCNVYCTPRSLALRQVQCGVRPLLHERESVADFPARAVMARAVRCRDRLRGGGERGVMGGAHPGYGKCAGGNAVASRCENIR